MCVHRLVLVLAALVVCTLVAVLFADYYYAIAHAVRPVSHVYIPPAPAAGAARPDKAQATPWRVRVPGSVGAPAPEPQLKPAGDDVAQSVMEVNTGPRI